MIKMVRQSWVWLVDRSSTHPFFVVLLALLLAVVCLFGAANRLSMDTNPDHLFSADLPWRQQSVAFAQQFPQFSDTLVAVVRAPTPEEAREAAIGLAQGLQGNPQVRSVLTPGISEFFDQNGLLLLPENDLYDVLDSMVQTGQLLELLVDDPSARGFMSGLEMMVKGVRYGMQDLIARYDGPLGSIAQTLNATLAGKEAPLSWQTLLTPGLVNQKQGGLELVLIQPVLDYDELEPGLKATQEMLRVAQTLVGVKEHRVTINYTGSVPLSDEEFGSLTDRALPIALGGALLMLFWLVLALRSWRLIIPVIVTLVLGLTYTLGFAAFAVGSLNLVSVAFAVLFVGLAIDFGIQFTVRLRALQHCDCSAFENLHSTALQVSGQVGLAAIAIACGFLAFAPTHFSGMAELGLIAGVGMLLALLCTLTLLPALLRLMAQSSPPAATVLLPGGKRMDDWLLRHCTSILWAFVALGVAGLISAIRLPFDANPLHTKSAQSESVKTLYSLMDDPNTNPFTLNVLVKDMDSARSLAKRLSELPMVAQVVSAADFVPEAQDIKLEAISGTVDLLYSLLSAKPKHKQPTAAELRKAAQKTSADIASVADKLPTGSALLQIGTELGKLAQASDAVLLNANDALSRYLPRTFVQLQKALNAKQITLANLPEDLKRDWFTKDGQIRIQITPNAEAENTEGLRRFVHAVQGVAPDAVGSALDTIMSADTIMQAFEEAAVCAFVVISLVLTLVLRRIRDTALVMMTLLMSALLTGLLAYGLGISLNFANIIALPLLLGVGVSFNVYFVMNWRNGMRQFMGSPTARAILFSALTTGTAFGALAISRHPGTASMGLVLLLSLSAVLLATFIFLPALLFYISRVDAEAKEISSAAI